MLRVKAGEPISITSPARERDPNLRLYVVFTDVDATRVAIRAAARRAGDLNARLVVLLAKVVPFPLPLNSPPVSHSFTDGVLSELVREQPAEITAQVYLCRDRNRTIRNALEPGSLVVIGRRRSWWPTSTLLLRKLLKRDGHQVVLVDFQRAPAARSGPLKVETSL